METNKTSREVILGICSSIKDEYFKLVTRPGRDEFWASLTRSDFFHSPASCYYHASFAGGLPLHSWQVYLNLLNFREKHVNLQHLSDETVFLTTVFHDLCKARYFKAGWKWYKGEDTGNKWIQKDVWQVEEKIPLGHGEKSIFMMQQHMNITIEEACMIRWHLGYFDAAAHTNWPTGIAISQAFKDYPSCIAAHLADMETAFTEEEDEFTKDNVKYPVPQTDKFGFPELNKLIDTWRTEANGEEKKA